MALKTASGEYRIRVPLSTTVDESTKETLKAMAKRQGISVAKLLDNLATAAAKESSSWRKAKRVKTD